MGTFLYIVSICALIGALVYDYLTKRKKITFILNLLDNSAKILQKPKNEIVYKTKGEWEHIRKKYEYSIRIEDYHCTLTSYYLEKMVFTSNTYERKPTYVTKRRYIFARAGGTGIFKYKPLNHYMEYKYNLKDLGITNFNPEILELDNIKSIITELKKTKIIDVCISDVYLIITKETLLNGYGIDETKNDCNEVTYFFETLVNTIRNTDLTRLPYIKIPPKNTLKPKPPLKYYISKVGILCLIVSLYFYFTYSLISIIYVFLFASLIFMICRILKALTDLRFHEIILVLGIILVTIFNSKLIQTSFVRDYKYLDKRMENVFILKCQDGCKIYSTRFQIILTDLNDNILFKSGLIISSLKIDNGIIEYKDNSIKYMYQTTDGGFYEPKYKCIKKDLSGKLTIESNKCDFD